MVSLEGLKLSVKIKGRPGIAGTAFLNKYQIDLETDGETSVKVTWDTEEYLSIISIVILIERVISAIIHRVLDVKSI